MLFNDSSVVRITVGNTIRASVTCPASIETPVPRYSTMNANPKRPKTMDGVPFSRSTPVRNQPRDAAFPGVLDQIDRCPDPEREGNGNRADNEIERTDDGRENPAARPESAGILSGTPRKVPAIR